MSEVRTPSHRDIVIGISERMRAARQAQGDTSEVVVPAPKTVKEQPVPAPVTGAVAPPVAKPVKKAPASATESRTIKPRVEPGTTTVDLPEENADDEGAAPADPNIG